MADQDGETRAWRRYPKPGTRGPGDAHIAYQVFGHGDTDLVWMPHWATHIEMLWEEPLAAAFFQGLASFSRVIMFDRRGVGLSDPVALAPPITVESWTEDLSAVLDAVELQRAAVAASDMAGFIAVLFAATHPDRTTALVLANATTRVRRAVDYPIGLPDHLAECRDVAVVRCGVLAITRDVAAERAIAMHTSAQNDACVPGYSGRSWLVGPARQVARRRPGRPFPVHPRGAGAR